MATAPAAPSTDPRSSGSTAARLECVRCHGEVSGVALDLPKRGSAAEPGSEVRGRSCARCGALYCRDCMKAALGWSSIHGYDEASCLECGRRLGRGTILVAPEAAAEAPSAMVVRAPETAATARPDTAPSPAPSPPPARLWSWPRVLFPVILLLVILGFSVGQMTRRYLGAAKARSAALAVASTPAGASVFVNGRLAGATPLRLEALAPGVYVLRLEKDGYRSFIKRLSLKGKPLEIQADLSKSATGSLKVEIEPRGAEVLLDGELVGLTPLRLREVPSGAHELVVRKTNFRRFTQRITVQPGRPLVFSGFSLPDQILAMLKGLIAAEPHRVAHYMDLGHYLFVNDRMVEAAEAYASALDLAARPLKLPKSLTPEGRQLELRLRREDVRRLHGEVKKKQHWPGKDVSRFRAKIVEIQERLAQQHLDNWAWIQQAANSYTQAKRYAQAERLYLRHLAAAPRSRNRGQAYIALLALRLRRRNFAGARETHQQFMAQFGKRVDLLRQAANTIYRSRGYFRGKERMTVLGLAEGTLRQALTVRKKGELAALCQFELGNVLLYQRRYPESLAAFEASIRGTASRTTKDLRSLRQAECLVKMKKRKEAMELYKRLSRSAIATVRAQAAKSAKALAARTRGK